jgi:ribosome-binding factor A
MQIPNHRVEKLIDDLESASAYIDFRSDCNQSLVDGLNAHADYLKRQLIPAHAY